MNLQCAIEPASLETSLILACRPLKHEEGGSRLVLSQKEPEAVLLRGYKARGLLHTGTGFLSVTGFIFRQGHFRNRVPSSLDWGL